MFAKQIDILAKCSKDILKKMANIDITDVKIKQEKTLSATYSIAHSIQYKDFDNKVKGDFILGFTDDSEAITIGSAIAEKIGLARIEQLDETASDIIGEFLNTVVGHTTTEWDKEGLNVRFNPPVLYHKKEINISDVSNTEAYLILLYFDPNQITLNHKAEALRLMVTFTTTLSKRILIAEDSLVMRNIISKALEKSGFETEQAKNVRRQ